MPVFHAPTGYVLDLKELVFQQPLGMGARSVVFLVTDKHSQCQFAVKVLHPETPKHAFRVEEEISVQRALTTHSQLVPLLANSKSQKSTSASS